MGCCLDLLPPLPSHRSYQNCLPFKLLQPIFKENFKNLIIAAAEARQKSPPSYLQGSSVSNLSACPLQRDWEQSLSQPTRVQQEKLSAHDDVYRGNKQAGTQHFKSRSIPLGEFCSAIIFECTQDNCSSSFPLG